MESQLILPQQRCCGDYEKEKNTSIPFRKQLLFLWTDSVE